MQFASVQKLFLVHDFDWQSNLYHSAFAHTVQENSSWKFGFCSLNLGSLGSLLHTRVDKCFWNRFIYLLVNGNKLNVSFSFNWSTRVEHKFEKTLPHVNIEHEHTCVHYLTWEWRNIFSLMKLMWNLAFVFITCVQQYSI